MSESVQFTIPRPPQSGNAVRAASGAKESGDGFDKALGEIAKPQAPFRGPEAVSRKPDRQDDTGEDKSARHVAGEAALLVRLFHLGDEPVAERPAVEHAANARVLFKVQTPAGKSQDERKSEGDETAVPIIAVAASSAAPAVRDTGTERTSGDKKPTGKAGVPIGDAAKAQKIDAMPGKAKEAASAKMADAADDATQKRQITNAEPDSGKHEAGGREGGHLAKVKVVSAHTAPAPVAAHLPTQTAVALARAIHTGVTSGTEAAHAAVAAAQKPAAPTAVHTLTIQLQPETLGTVTARLQLSGDNLRVELQADNASAHHRLKTDSETILKSLRALGYDVDRVTIQAPPPAQHAASGHNAASQGREQSFQQAAGNSGNGQGSSHAGSGRENGQGTGHQTMERQEQHSSSGGIFI